MSESLALYHIFRAISPRTGRVFTRQSFRPYTHAVIHFTSAAAHAAHWEAMAVQHEKWASEGDPKYRDHELARAAQYRENAAQAFDTEEATFHSSEALARNAKSYATSVTVVAVEA